MIYLDIWQLGNLSFVIP